MIETVKKSNTLKSIGLGLSVAGLTATYSVCFVAATGMNLIFALICSVICALFSLKLKNSIMAPHTFMIVPLIYTLTQSSSMGVVISLSVAAILFFIFNKLNFKIEIPSSVVAGAFLGFAISVTILLTNVYFGIGAYGSTPFEMLKNYRYLGFHPNFMGLLTGTITLFAMITYPFKFKKLSKLIPAPFITIFIPYVLNIFLNPKKEYTTINEAVSMGKITDFDLSSEISALNPQNVFVIIESVFVFFFLFCILSKNETNENVKIMSINNIFSGLPACVYKFENYTLFSAISCILICVVVMLFFPDILQRIPLHCVGAMLIVAGWQSTPFGKISLCFKSKKISNIIIFLVCTVSFIIFKAYTATIICIILCLISTPKRKEIEEI